MDKANGKTKNTTAAKGNEIQILNPLEFTNRVEAEEI